MKQYLDTLSTIPTRMEYMRVGISLIACLSIGESIAIQDLESKPDQSLIDNYTRYCTAIRREHASDIYCDDVQTGAQKYAQAQLEKLQDDLRNEKARCQVRNSATIRTMNFDQVCDVPTGILKIEIPFRRACNEYIKLFGKLPGSVELLPQPVSVASPAVQLPNAYMGMEPAINLVTFQGARAAVQPRINLVGITEFLDSQVKSTNNSGK